MKNTIEELEEELDEIFANYQGNDCDSAPLETLIDACVNRFAGGNVELKQFLTKNLDPSGTSDGITKRFFKEKLKELFLCSLEKPNECYEAYEGNQLSDANNRINSEKLNLSLLKKLQSLEERNSLLEANLSKSDQKITTLENTLSSLKNDSKRSKETFQAKNKDLENSLLEANLKFSGLEFKYNNLTSIYTKAESEIRKLKDIEEKYEETMERLRFFEQETFKHKNDLKTLKSFELNLLKELESARKSKDEMSLEVGKLVGEVALLIENQEALLSRIETLKCEKQALLYELTEMKCLQNKYIHHAVLQSSLDDLSNSSIQHLNLQQELEECGYSKGVKCGKEDSSDMLDDKKSSLSLSSTATNSSETIPTALHRSTETQTELCFYSENKLCTCSNLEYENVSPTSSDSIPSPGTLESMTFRPKNILKCFNCRKRGITNEMDDDDEQFSRKLLKTSLNNENKTSKTNNWSSKSRNVKRYLIKRKYKAFTMFVIFCVLMMWFQMGSELNT